MSGIADPETGVQISACAPYDRSYQWNGLCHMSATGCIHQRMVTRGEDAVNK
jgi:hypothetical protein